MASGKCLLIRFSHQPYEAGELSPSGTSGQAQESNWSTAVQLVRTGAGLLIHDYSPLDCVPGCLPWLVPGDI